MTASQVHVPQLDLVAQYRTLQPEMDAAVKRVMESGYFILGPEVAALEREVAEYVGVKYAVGVASGTDALWLSLRALGIGPGDEVIVPAFTFWATAGVVLLCGATPILVDVDAETYCMTAEAFEAAITPRTRAVIPVHLFGEAADMRGIMAVAQRHGVRVVEDCAQAIGARDGDRKVGSFGDTGCFSFYPTKNLGGYGDGGMVVTNDEELATGIKMLRTHGWKRKYAPEVMGQNSRLDELQAAILRVKMPHLDAWNDARRHWAHAYTAQIEAPGVRLPSERADAHHVYHLYVIEVEERERVAKALSAAGVDTAVYYPLALHQVPIWAEQGLPTGSFPVSEAGARRCLALPLYPEMDQAQVDHVARALAQATQAGA